MLQTLLTVLLLVVGFLAGLRFRSIRRVAMPLGVLWVAVTVTNFVTAQVAEAGDRPAFLVSAVVVLGLVLGLPLATTYMPRFTPETGAHQAMMRLGYQLNCWIRTARARPTG
jgi:energy-coupling factor transporter transmembrane protein EcfT